QEATDGNEPGYLCLSRTGMDLFRPLVTLRLARSKITGEIDVEAAIALIYEAIPVGAPVILSALPECRPVIDAIFDIQKEELLRIYVLDRGRFEPIINVLVVQSETYNGLPRFVARPGAGDDVGGRGEILASAGLNWRSTHFAEIYVHTKAPHRRQGLGRSVVASIVQHTLESGRRPLYAVNRENQASIQLAESVGFVDIGIAEIMFEGTLRPPP
ncbi:MAG: GNAT family N-acetyltransferase, partial [Kiloniellales bacterium]|nr:GNAT family N-acetyltransferase [Kiloniellales bacterium]